MLRIYPVALQIVREVRPLADRIAKLDRDHARQLRRSTLSMASNIGEGCGHVGGVQRSRFFDALGSAREALVQLECAEATGYIDSIAEALHNRFDHVIGVLVKLTR